MISQQQTSHIQISPKKSPIAIPQFSFQSSSQDNSHHILHKNKIMSSKNQANDKNVYKIVSHQNQRQKDKQNAQESLYIQKIKQNPQNYITQQTSRDHLFRMIYLLQQQNDELSKKFDIGKKLIIQQSPSHLNLSQIEQINKISLSNANHQQKQAIIQSIKQKNSKYIAQSRLLQLYKKQNNEMSHKIQKKQQNIQKLTQQKQKKQKYHQQLVYKLKQGQDKLVQYKQIKTKLIDELNKNKMNEKNKDSGSIDKLLDQYYDNLKSVISQGSVDRLKKNTQQVVKEINKKRNFNVMTESININININMEDKVIQK